MATPRAPGSIAGKLGYPSEGIPPMAIYAISVSNQAGAFRAVETIPDQDTYAIEGLSPGAYYVLDKPRDLASASSFFGAYTRSVVCKTADCNDHTLLPVAVHPGEHVLGVDPIDWIDRSAFPSVPSGGPSPATPASPPGSFRSARDAAVWDSQNELAAISISGSIERCPINRACVELGDEIDGKDAAYFLGRAGSNNDDYACAAYVYRDRAGWQPLTTVCTTLGSTFPVVGRRDTVSIRGADCVKVQADPGFAARAVGCLADGTSVVIDGGPVFVQEGAATDFPSVWWHLHGKGWMVYAYLTPPY